MMLRTALLAALALTLASCDDDADGTFSVQVTNVPAATTALDVSLSTGHDERVMTFQGAAALAELADGAASFAVVVPAGSHIEVVVEARSESRVLARAAASCELPCPGLILTLSPPPTPDAGMPLPDDGRDDAGP